MNQPSQKNILLIGAGGHGLVIAEIITAAGKTVVGFMDQKKTTSQHGGYEVYDFNDAHTQQEGLEYVISIGNNLTRKKISESHLFSYGNAIHPSSIISPSADIGKGTVVMAGVCVNAAARIGAHAILNTGCIIEHECVLEDYVHISPRVALAGNVHIGEGTHVGIGAVILPGIHIGKWCTIGAGAVVTQNVPDATTVVGVPARPILK